MMGEWESLFWSLIYKILLKVYFFEIFVVK